jgi:drug/metabolite transporter (DMT)-like permease
VSGYSERMTQPDASQQQSKFRPTPQQVLGALLAVVAIVFIAENGRKTKIRFIGPEVTTWLWLALLVAAALGFLAGVLVTRHRRK